MPAERLRDDASRAGCDCPEPSSVRTWARCPACRADTSSRRQLLPKPSLEIAEPEHREDVPFPSGFAALPYTFLTVIAEWIDTNRRSFDTDVS